MLTILRIIIKLLSNRKEYSVKTISYNIKSHWQTTINALEFLAEIGVVKERKGEKTYKEERLFSLSRN